MVKNKKDSKEENLQLVEGALSRSEQFIEDNSKILSIVIGAVIVIAAIYLAYTRLYVSPKQQEALEAMFQAENYFEQDSFALALNGDGSSFGFLDIINDFGMTKAGNLAGYYAGVCYLRLGDFDNAIEHLDNFSSDDIVIRSMAYGLLGDAWSEKGSNDKAIKFYQQAADLKNDFSAPLYLMKAGLLYESKGDYKKALAAYETIKKEYKVSMEARNIDKYIQRAQLNQ